MDAPILEIGLNILEMLRKPYRDLYGMKAIGFEIVSRFVGHSERYAFLSGSIVKKMVEDLLDVELKAIIKVIVGPMILNFKDF